MPPLLIQVNDRHGCKEEKIILDYDIHKASFYRELLLANKTKQKHKLYPSVQY